MGDVGEYWRDDGYKERQRAKMGTCWRCNTNVFFGEECHLCGDVYPMPDDYTNCDSCGAIVKKVGLADHKRAVHKCAKPKEDS